MGTAAPDGDPRESGDSRIVHTVEARQVDADSGADLQERHLACLDPSAHGREADGQAASGVGRRDKPRGQCLANRPHVIPHGRGLAFERRHAFRDRAERREKDRQPVVTGVHLGLTRKARDDSERCGGVRRTILTFTVVATACATVADDGG